MKYPFIIFYRHEKYNAIDKYFRNNESLLNCSIFVADTISELNNLHNSNYHLLVTYGTTFDEYETELLNIVSSNMLLNRHIHISPEDEISKNIQLFNEYVNVFYVSSCCINREETRPTFSLFTPSYNSYNKILRVYNSLLKQTLVDWEWVIMDDSPDDNNFQFLRNKFSDDSRIRFYRRSSNNGSIGNVKNETIGLCRGKYVLEMDHDDELMPYVLKESADIFNGDKNKEIGFIYYDCACVYENGKNQWYGDFICKGYGGYYSQKYEGVWRLIYITPNINNITLSHLICCPNHPRIWRRDVLMELGSYCEYLPICDDYEIILKTALSTKMAKVHKLGYIQYMNDSNNNFSLIRNGEINRIGPKYISPIYYQTLHIHEKMKEKEAYEDEIYMNNYSKIWERDIQTYQHKYCNLIMNVDYDKQFCIIGFDSLLFYIDKITELYQNKRNDFIVLENKGTTEYLQQRLDNYKFENMKCYSLVDTSNEQLINYFKLLYLSADDYEILNMNANKLAFNTHMTSRAHIINSLTNKDDNYLEIGVEYGDTFKETHFMHKIGVDPDPKFESNIGTLVKLTSDEYFNQINNDNDTQFNAIFIDGMHQVEYVLKDLNNSIKVLANDGILFIDDILPFNYNEQLKIPIKHYYENGILKYGENWTGDVWKVLYYLLLHHKKNITINYFYNINFRGIATIKIKEKFTIDETHIETINSFDYFKDYMNYLELL
jgi:glycosyltransferase involved in cell wall biosynthesis